MKSIINNSILSAKFHIALVFAYTYCYCTIKGIQLTDSFTQIVLIIIGAYFAQSVYRGIKEVEKK